MSEEQNTAAGSQELNAGRKSPTRWGARFRDTSSFCLSLITHHSSLITSFSSLHPTPNTQHPLSSFLLALLLVTGASAQSVRTQRARRVAAVAASRSHESVAPPTARVMIERAIGEVCRERDDDPLGSVPIDVMQAHPSLPLGHASVVLGRQRAERLLPLAQQLVVEVLESLAVKYKIPAWRIRIASRHVRAVRRIEPDMELRDNAAVYLTDQRTIRFGTIFLASLQSDEGMTSILAHELTHVADGPEDVLHLLFRQLGRRASELTGLAVTGRRPEELSCDLVGEMVVHALVALAPTDETRTRRLARAVEHNCVELDNTDQAHLSPRNTLRALFALDGALTHDFLFETTMPPTITTTPPSVLRDPTPRPRPTSLTTPHAHSYHRRFR